MPDKLKALQDSLATIKGGKAKIVTRSRSTTPKKAPPKKKAAPVKVTKPKVPAKKPAVKKAKAPPEIPLNVSINKGYKFEPGNRHWEVRSSHGRKPLFATPEALWNAAVEYFAWSEENPLIEEKCFQYMGAIVVGEVKKMRALTIQGLCLYLDISDETWSNYKAKPDFVGICEHIAYVIYNQKITGAAAGLLNPAIIASEVGLKNKVEAELTGKDGGPIEQVVRKIVKC